MRQHGGRKEPVENVLSQLAETLEKRERKGRIRRLQPQPRGAVDFSSNDYLGLARCQELVHKIKEEAERVEALNRSRMEPMLGSTGSRLLSGNTWYHDEVEAWMANFFQREGALIFNSGYDLNLGLLACLTRPGDAVVYDELVHNSTIMGLRLGSTREDGEEKKPIASSFLHNDVNDLEARLAEIRQEIGLQASIFIPIEGLYSMDGDLAPLTEICEVALRYGACVIVDEAHSTGILGIGGRGLVCEADLQNHPALLCSIHTFGKAMGCHGAVLCGPKILLDYCVNYCAPFVYSTALSIHSLVCMRVACEYQSQQDHRRARLNALIIYFQKVMQSIPMPQAKDYPAPSLLPSPTAIQAVLVPGNQRVATVALRLQSHGLDVRALRSPTVAAGKERLRIILHAHNTEEEIDDLISHLSKILSGTSEQPAEATQEVRMTELKGAFVSKTIPPVTSKSIGTSLILHPSRL